ncbi:MAG: carbohydrate binding family 9 domain-containing protein [Candidatus Aminicenantes bacterium]|nr:carbohydrate binding family 9 domain-containing protein [Candidatus Aminicenantes bacterium]
MRKNCFCLFMILLALNLAAPAAEQVPPPAHFTITPAVSKIKVDGILDEDVWQKATMMKLPFEQLPGDNTPAPVETECLLTFDRAHLYIAFRCLDPEPGKIRAHLMDRDAIDTFIQDDHISVIIDAFNDERRGFQFRVNPLGVQADANFSELEGYEDFSWDAIWASAGKITDWGYAVEMAIPFNQLRFARTDRTFFSKDRICPGALARSRIIKAR